MKGLKTTFFFGLLFSTYIVFSQAQVGLKTVDIEAESKINEEEIERIAYDLLNADSKQQKIDLNQALKKLLLKELNKEEAKNHPFTNIKSLSVLTPEDSSFRLFNWNIPYANGTFDFECGILNLNSNKDSAFTFLTEVVKDSIHENYIGQPNEWVPGLIYDLVQFKTQFETYYTLLVWDGNNVLTNKKSIDVLWFDADQNARFGAPILVSNQGRKCRRIFEFGNENKMRLYFDSLNQRIVFDHLSPSKPNLEGIYEYYGADLSYDAYQWSGSFWRYHADIDTDKGSQKKKKDFKVDKDVIREDRPIYKSN